MHSKRKMMLLLAATAAALLPGTAMRARSQQPPRVVEITAKRFGFTPAQIELKRGETVTLRIHSEDVTHGLFVRPLKIDTDIEPGKTTDLTITPEQAGTFSAICDHFCGAGHGNMKLAINVTE